MSSQKFSQKKLSKLISSLNIHFELVGEDFADILWLGLKQKEYQQQSTKLKVKINLVTPFEMKFSLFFFLWGNLFLFLYLWIGFIAEGLFHFLFLPEVEMKSELPAPPDPSVPITPPSSSQSGIGGINQQALPLRHPDPPSIQNPLEFAKALRPLIRKVPSGRKTLLDEAETVHKTAEQGLCLPVFRNEPEAWLDLALVIDSSPSMLIWSSTIKELKKILIGYGIFREAKVWDLLFEDNDQISISSSYGNKERKKPFQQLVDPTRRRLILIVSDCVDPVWSDGSLLPILESWTKHQPLAIIQMLPQLMWQMTGLRIGAFVELANLVPGAANRNLRIQELLIWKKITLEQGAKVPVLTLNPDSTSLWSDFNAGKYGVLSPGFVFPEKLEFDTLPKPPKSAHARVTELNAEQRVARFRRISSPIGRNLAGYLVSAPVITLPVIRLIRKIYIPESEPAHVAEVLLGGIFKPTIRVSHDTNPDGIVFDVAEEEIRPILQDDFPLSDSVDVFREISRFIENELGKTLRECVALLQDTTQTGEENALARAYGEISLKVLDGLGGKNKEFADRIRQGVSEVYGGGSISSANLITLKRKVALHSPSDDFARYRRALKAISDNLGRSGWLDVVNEDEQPDFRLLINQQGQFEIANGNGDVFTNVRPPLFADDINAQQTAKRLVHVAQFSVIEQLDNPESKLAESIEFELLDYDRNSFADPENISISIKTTTYLKIKNNSPHRVYCTVLDLEPTWEISAIPLSPREGLTTYPIEPGSDHSIRLQFTLPEDKLYDSAIETIKLFVYTDERPPFELLSMPSLDGNLEKSTRVPLEVSRGLKRLDPKAREFLEVNTLGKLLTNISNDLDEPESNTRGNTYDLQSQSEVDWATKKIRITRVSSQTREIVVKNTFAPAEPDENGQSRWNWRVYLDNEPSLLDEIESVEYTLHETFEDRVRVINYRQSNFALDSNGWGEFEIQIRVFFKDGTNQELSHWLDLGLDLVKVVILAADSVPLGVKTLSDVLDEVGGAGHQFLIKPISVGNLILEGDVEQVRDLVVYFISQEPRKSPTILHYLGFEENEDEFIDSKTLDNLFSILESKVSCVLINSDYIHNQVKTINKYVDYVIGIDRQGFDDEIIAFCRGFYRAFGSGESIEEAFEKGKNEILIEAGKSFEGLSVPPVSLKPFLYRRDFDLKPLNIATAKISFKEDPMRVFETITVDETGQITKRETHRNNFFEEKLGEDIEPLTMMAIPEGEFMMGSPEDEKERHDDESPQHQVKVTPFWLAQTPVTFAQWNFVVNNLAQEKRGLNPKESKDKDEHPVTEVSWYDAIEFCARLTRHTGRNYRLPSEAEWEYAARAGTTTPFHFGETITGELANYDASATYANETAGEWKNQTISVKNFKPNAFGLYDIHGQVFEWCADPWHDSYEEAPQERDSSVWDEEKENDNFYRNILDNLPKLLKDERSRILRGGSYYDNPRNCRSAYRNRNNPVIDSTFYGFRLAVSDPRTL